MKVRLLLGPLLAIGLLLPGCGYDAVKEQKVKKELAQMALDYVKEKYGMKEAKLAEVKLSHGGYNGPIPDFKHEVPDRGDSFIASARTNTDFMIVYRMKK
ncbi:hypothetical protein D3C78_1094920 [compost metagenome]